MEREIERLKREFSNQSESSLQRFRDQLARQELAYRQRAIEALKKNDLATALNMVLQAELLSELRKRA